MFNQMPQILQNKVVELLENNDFTAAKEIYDDWHKAVSLACEIDDGEEIEPECWFSTQENIFLPRH